MDENRDYGLTLWLAYDPVSQKASVTLLMAYISFILAVGSVVALHFSNLLSGTLAALALFVISTIFYLIRSLSKAKIDLDDKSFELEGENKKEEK